MTRYESTPFRLVSRRFILCKVELLGWKSKLKSGSQVGSFRISAQKGSERERGFRWNSLKESRLDREYAARSLDQTSSKLAESNLTTKQEEAGKDSNVKDNLSLFFSYI